MRAFAAIAVVSAVLIAAPLTAQATVNDHFGFACNSIHGVPSTSKPRVVLNHLVCTSKNLSVLHEQLAELQGEPTDMAEFRTIMTERATGHCDLEFDPTQNIEAKWAADDCLSRLYRCLISERGAKPAGNVVRGRLPTGFIHPACLDDLLALTHPIPYRTDISPCFEGTRRITFILHTVKLADGVDQTIIYDRWNTMPWGGYLGYSSAGRPTDTTELLWVFENRGGAGRFHTLALLSGPDGDGATGEWLREGGDEYWVEVLGRVAFGNRCRGGLAVVSITGPVTARVAVNITPFAMLVLGEQGALPTPTATSLAFAGATIEAGHDLIDHAEACIGTAEFDVDLKTGGREFAGVTIDELYYWDIADVRFQACFNHLVRSKLRAMPATLTPEDLKSLGGDFVDRCIGP